MKIFKEGDLVLHEEYRPEPMVVVRVNEDHTITCTWTDDDTNMPVEHDFDPSELRFAEDADLA